MTHVLGDMSMIRSTADDIPVFTSSAETSEQRAYFVNAPIICWFRQDLRLADNPAFHSACSKGTVLPVYIHDDEDAGDARMGSASRVWLYHSLRALNDSLGGGLCCFSGPAEPLLTALAKQVAAPAVYWNRCYEPWRIDRDMRIKAALAAAGHAVESYNGSLLWEPWENLKPDGTHYKVFTPFYRRGCLGMTPPALPLPIPDGIDCYPESVNSLCIDDLGLLPELDWHRQLVAGWEIGEAGAQARWTEFLGSGINNYKQGRNFPARKSVSRLSPHLHFGEISPRQCWHEAQDIRHDDDPNLATFQSELAWREFSYSLLYHHPQLRTQPLQGKFADFNWRESAEDLRRWQRGTTGIPIVDAGMRELYQTGYMHNRVRMIVGSFLVKNLRLHWHHGERWFWDCLFDADLANNSAGWQWIAGCGADAAPYFRIFNPVTQARKFDPEGQYIRRYVPELANLPDAYLAAPWDAPRGVLAASNVTLGQDYPYPVIDVRQSRQEALAAFSELGNKFLSK